jgi:predicted PurR-regulated permease PerM
MTRAVDISPAAVLLSALIGGSLLGFVGALMAIPTAASLKLIFQEVVLPRTEKA